MPYNFAQAQVVPPAQPTDASNPASGINNIPMQGGIDVGGAVGTATPASAPANGVPAEEAIKILNQVAEAGFKAYELRQPIEDLFNRLTNPYIRDRVGTLMQALDKNNDPRTQTKDPQTGFKDPTASQMAKNLVEEIKKMEAEQKKLDNTGEAKAASTKSFNLRESAGKKKKKKRDSRGNPFKVLMGKVGKLLDHGISKRDIVRFLIKEGHWNEETVEKAVNLVRDYNKKKHRGDKKLKEKALEHENDKLAQNNSNVMGRSFNQMRYAQTSLELDGVYGVQPEWTKRSTAELIMRASWLISLQNYDEDTKQGDGKKAASKKGAAAQLKEIKKALSERGFDGDELFNNLQRRFENG